VRYQFISEDPLPGFNDLWQAADRSVEAPAVLVDCKRQEMEVFAQRVTDFEYHTYLETV
jgi:hypothetical protein